MEGVAELQGQGHWGWGQGVLCDDVKELRYFNHTQELTLVTVVGDTDRILHQWFHIVFDTALIKLAS